MKRVEIHVVELNVKDFGLQGAIANALNATNVEVLASMSSSLIPFRCDWLVSNKQINGVADVVAKVDGIRTFFQVI